MKKFVMCGDVKIGGGEPISIQSMTNTDTRDIKSSVEQIKRLENADCRIVRMAIPDMEGAYAFGEIKKKVKVPLVADIHFDYRLALEAIKQGADKIRINPGNIGDAERVKIVATAAKERGIPIRVGVNSGSLEKDIVVKYGGVTSEGLAESALRNIEILENMGFEDIVISLKSSNVKLNYEAHSLIARKTEYPIHIGITESGTAEGGKLKSAIGIGSLLLAGIGDTMRVSLTGDPVNEVTFAKEILKSVGIRPQGINLISCPTCGRTKVNLENIACKVEVAMKKIEAEREKKGLRPITVAVMGCAVNGPGEAREADFGVAGGDGQGLIFAKGEIIKKVPEDMIVEELIKLVKNA